MTTQQTESNHVVDYTRESGQYHQKRYTGERAEFLEEIRRECVSRLLPGGELALDVATGTGRGSCILKGRYERVCAIDGTLAMLVEARGNLEGVKGNPVTLSQANAGALPFRDNQFDTVTSFNFLHLFDLEQQRTFVREMTRVLKPGGTLVVELNSALYGLILGPIRKMQHDIGYTWPTHVRKMVRDGVKIERVVGTNIPVIWRLRKICPGLLRRLEGLGRFFPFNYLMQRVFVVAKKHAE